MSPYYQRLRAQIGHDLLLVPSVGAVIRNEDGALLLQEKEREGWSLPAGAIEPGESPEDAIRREVLEETGLVVKSTRIQGVFGGAAFGSTYPNGDTVEYTVLLYRCTVQRGAHAPIDAETKALKYFSREQMPELALPYPGDVLFGH